MTVPAVAAAAGHYLCVICFLCITLIVISECHELRCVEPCGPPLLRLTDPNNDRYLKSVPVLSEEQRADFNQVELVMTKEFISQQLIHLIACLDTNEEGGR